eukprot:1153840-Pelagomonas_calceolata.AAC.5
MRTLDAAQHWKRGQTGAGDQRVHSSNHAQETGAWVAANAAWLQPLDTTQQSKQGQTHAGDQRMRRSTYAHAQGNSACTAAHAAWLQTLDTAQQWKRYRRPQAKPQHTAANRYARSHVCSKPDPGPLQ